MNVLGVVAAYFIGSIPFALLLARRWGTGDLRRVGSGNIGAANVLRASGVKAGLLVAVLDVAKGAAGVLGLLVAQCAALAHFFGKDSSFAAVLFGGAVMGIFSGIYFWFPKMTGRFLSEGLGKLHFWLMFIGMNMTFFPMHFSGMLGMPRRIYTYDVGQGWETFNLWSTIGVFFQGAGLLIFAYNFFKSRSTGSPASNDPWGAGTLEWSIPSPPPEYNFAQLPVVTSRYPLWDLKSPERTADLAHSAPDAMTITDSHAAPMHEETERKTAKELGIPMPFPTIKPLFTALFMVLMFVGLIFLHLDKFALAMVVTIGSAAAFVGSLYGWLTSPLE